jgi:hypothetical protein
MSDPTFEEMEMRRKLDGLLVDRLSNIESELKKMRDLLVRSALLEERMVRVMESHSRLEFQNNDIINRISAIETSNASNKERVGGNERILWLFVTAAVGAIATWLSSKP